MIKKGIFIKILSALLIVIMFVTLTPVELLGKYVQAEEGVSSEGDELGEAPEINEVWDGVSIQAPKLYGYEYRINSAAELAWFANEVNNKNTFEGKSIFITGNIDLNKKEWTIIGNTTSDNPCEIKGNIIIRNAVIKGLFLSSSSSSNKGLFGSVRVWDMDVDNLMLEDVGISGTKRNYDGLFFASLEIARGGHCDIKNSNFSGTISGMSNCGGLAGYVSGVNDNATLSVVNCNIKVESTSYNTMWDGSKYNSDLKGGVIGRYYTSANNNWLILNGIYCNDNLHSFNEYGYNTCTAGGVIGELEGNANVLVYQCAVTGNIISCGDQGYAGGIVGKMISCNRYKQSDTYVTAAITSSWNAYGYAYNAGGFIEGPTEVKPVGYIKNSYFAGASSTAAAFIAKDKLGQDTNLKIYNCYYDSTLCRNNVFHTDWLCYTISNSVFDCAAYPTESMRTQSNYVGWDFDNIWIMGEIYPELRRENFELPDDFLEDITWTIGDSEIVRIVREYASEDFYAQWETIWNSEYSDDVKAEKILALASSYGITDPREGLEFVSKSSSKRRAYRILTTDEMYMASNFLNWLDEDGNFERLLLVADGLIFNREINEWLDIETYIESDYPGISKYKDMLYAYMDLASDKNEAWEDVKLASKLAKNVTDANKTWVKEKITQINSSNSREERGKIIDEMKEKGVFTSIDDMEDLGGLDIKFNYKLDETSGFGQFAKAMGNATKTIDIVDMTISDIRDFLILDSKLQTYYQFTEFLNDIIAARSEVPFELSAAAKQIQEEMEAGYWKEIKDIAWQFIGQTGLTSAVKEEVLSKLGTGSISTYLTVINIEAWFINQVVDIGSVVKKEAYVEGYAYLARLYKKRLETSREKFLNCMTEENAWDFYYNYNMLYSLRVEGEKAYLSMCNLKGLCGKMLSFGYAVKEEGVNEVLSILKDSCQFDLGENVSVPESMEYLSKLVVSCPVDVIVYTQAGDCIAELRDGELKDISNEYGRFAVVYNYYTGDYEKVVCLLDNTVKVDIIAKDDGLVGLQFAYTNNDTTKILSISNTPVLGGDTISVIPEELQESRTVAIVSENVTSELEFNEVDSSYVNLSGASLSENELSINVGEQKLLTVTLEPQNASIQDITWYSSDPDVASVKNGCVKALQEGTVVIYGILGEKSAPLVCTLTVSTPQSVEAPIANVKSGAYTSNQSIILTSLTEGADIYYAMTLDGTEPELTYEAENIYTGPIVAEGISGSLVTVKIKAVARKSGMIDSDVITLEYVIDLADEPQVAPTIIEHPSDTTVIVGGTATFSVAADGSEPLTYQWFVDENVGTFVAIDGATSASYTTNEVSMDYNGYKYYCVVTNSMGNAMSDMAILSVNEASATVYAIVVSSDGNGSATANVSQAEAGTIITITATASDGYIFKEWEVTSDEGILESKTSASTTFIMPSANVNVKAIFEKKEEVQPIEYHIIAGAEGTWIIDSEGSMSICGDGDISKFVAVKIDDSIIDQSNYDIKSGSTVIILKKEYLDTLSEGIHIFEIIWGDGSAGTTFTIKKVEMDFAEESIVPEIPDTPDNPNESEILQETSIRPETPDESSEQEESGLLPETSITLGIIDESDKQGEPEIFSEEPIVSGISNTKDNLHNPDRLPETKAEEAMPLKGLVLFGVVAIIVIAFVGIRCRKKDKRN